MAGGLGAAAPFSGAVGEGVGAGALSALPSGAVIPGAAAPTMMSKLISGGAKLSQMSQDPGGTIGTAIGKGLGASPETTEDLGMIGKGIAGAPPPPPSTPGAPIPPGRKTQLAQPVTQIKSQFAIGPDGLLHFTGAPTAMVGGGLA